MTLMTDTVPRKLVMELVWFKRCMHTPYVTKREQWSSTKRYSEPATSPVDAHTRSTGANWLIVLTSVDCFPRISRDLPR